MTRLHVVVVPDLGSYLGMSSYVGKNKSLTFQLIKDRIWKKLNGWSSKLLSKARKEVLIKAVAQSIPTYVMTCFKLPVSLLNELSSMISRFWWGKTGGKKSIHWMRWLDLCTPKLQGGLGFRDFECFNEALICKQGWRIIKQPSLLMSTILKAKYFPSTEFTNAREGSNPSYIWRNLMQARPLLLSGLRWRIGNGESVTAATGAWIPRPSSFQLFQFN